MNNLFARLKSFFGSGCRVISGEAGAGLKPKGPGLSIDSAAKFLTASLYMICISIAIVVAVRVLVFIVNFCFFR